MKPSVVPSWPGSLTVTLLALKNSQAGVDGGEFSLQRFVFDPLGLIWRSEYFRHCGRSSGCFRKQFSIKWLVIPLLT